MHYRCSSAAVAGTVDQRLERRELGLTAEHVRHSQLVAGLYLLEQN
jgi:hypothetical protein